MKKVLVFIALVFSIATQAQERKVVTTLFSGNVADTTLTMTYDGDYRWAVSAVWASGVGTLDATVTVQVSNDRHVNYVSYATNSTKTLSTAAGSWQFEDDILAWRYLRVKVLKNTLTSGTVAIKIVKIQK